MVAGSGRRGTAAGRGRPAASSQGARGARGARRGRGAGAPAGRPAARAACPHRRCLAASATAPDRVPDPDPSRGLGPDPAPVPCHALAPTDYVLCRSNHRASGSYPCSSACVYV